MPNPNTPVNKFPVGNQFYKLASYTGRPRLFANPDDLWASACDYFDWCKNNPLIEFKVKGSPPRIVEIPKMRAMSLQGLSVHIGLCNLRRYKQNAVFAHVIAYIETVILAHNISGAAAGLLNPCIVARTLGLWKKAANKKVPDENTSIILFEVKDYSRR